MRWIVALALLMTTTNLFAWNQKTRDHVSRFSTPYSDPYVSTLRGVAVNRLGWAQDGLPSASTWKQHASYIYATIPSDHLRSGRLLSFALLHKGQKRDMIFMIPGVFSGIDASNDGLFRSLAWSLYHEGYHVVGVPNPWSDEYTAQRPKTLPGNYRAEVKVMHDAFRSLLHHYKSKGLVADTQLFGYSYGAAIAAGVAGRDGKLREFGQTVTLISPPVDFGKTLRKMDHLIQKYAKPYHRWTDFQAGRIAFRVLAAKNSQVISPLYLRHTRGVTLFKGFQDRLVKASEAMSKQTGIRWDDSMANPLTFKRFIATCTDCLKQINGPESHLRYWVDEARSKGKRVNILAAEDDFINVNNVWWSHPDHLMVPHGGHMGFVGTKWFTEFLDKAF